MALRSPFREVIALAAAAVAGTATIAVLGAAYNLFVNGLIDRTELGSYVFWVVQSVAPIALLCCLAVSPVLMLMRRRGSLRSAWAVGLFAIVPVVVLAIEAVVQPSIDTLPPLQVAMSVALYVVAGVAGGLAYWAVRRER